MVRNKLYICKEWHIQPSEINVMPFYEYEQILQEINIVQKEQEKRQQQQEKQQNSMMKGFNPSTMMNSFRNTTNNLPGMKMPTIHIPKL